MPSPPLRRALVGSFLLCLFSVQARAEDRWSDPFPGVRHLHRTGPSRLSLHAAVVDLCATGVSVRHTDFTERAQRTSAFASSVGAQLAINGDWSCRPVDVGPRTQFEPCRGLPAYITYGVAAHEGRIWPGSPFNDAMMAFAPGRVETYEWPAHAEPQPWMSEIISGHFQLVRDGAVSFEARTGDPNAYGPRSGIGLSQDRTRLVMAVVDGRNGRRGMNEAELAGVLVELGAHAGFGLDGGGSSTMWMEGRGVLNSPSDGSERTVGPHLAVFAGGNSPPLHCDRPWRYRPEVGLGGVRAIGRAAGFHPVTPRRLYDTRQPALSEQLSGDRRAASGRVAAQTQFRLDTMSHRGVANSTVAAAVNLTLVDPQGWSYVAAWSGDGAMPDTSLLNAPPGVNRANSALIGFTGSPGFNVFSYSEAHHLADLTGTFDEGGLGLVAEAPRRILDTRQGQRLEANQPRRIVEPSGAGVGALALGFVVVGPEAPGFLTVYPCQDGVPDVSTANFRAGEVVAASALIGTGREGICAQSSTPTHLIVDRFARFESGRGALFQPVVPYRVVDSRRADGRWSGRLPAGTVAEIPFSELGDFPDDAVAVSLNVTAVEAAADGHASLGPCGQPAPTTSTINFANGETIAVAATAALHEGKVCLFAHGRSHFLVDINGYYIPRPPEPPPVDAGSPRPDTGPPPAQDAGKYGDTGPYESPDASTGSDTGEQPGSDDAGADGPVPGTPPTGCACAGGPSEAPWLLLLVWVLWRRRSPPPRSST